MKENASPQNNMLSRIILKAKKYAIDDPEVALPLARIAAELICINILTVIYKERPGKMELDQMIQKINQHKILPPKIIIHLNTIRSYGNYGSHAQYEEQEIEKDYIITCMTALEQLSTWYYEEHLRNEVPEEIQNISIDIINSLQENNRLSKLQSNSIRLIDKHNATDIINHKLSDTEVKSITIVTYTNEVESGIITPYKVSKGKSINIYKRSLMADLAEQQYANIMRMIYGINNRRWDKYNSSMNASLFINKNFKNNKAVNVLQYFYDYAPSKRVYLFDDNEALVSFYEVQDILTCEGSIYKGMGGSTMLWVKAADVLGRYFIDEIKNYVKSLEKRTRTWGLEESLLTQQDSTYDIKYQPCINPKAVFLDLDGVLYDSLPFYVEAWSRSFIKYGIELEKEEVYRQEGRSGRETIKYIYNKYQKKEISDTVLEKILLDKNNIIDKLGKPPIQNGAIKLLEAIRKSGLEMYIVTGSSKRGVIDEITSDFGEYIQKNNIICGRDIKLGKPNPEPYLLAQIKAGIHPTSGIVVENAPLGIQSAIKSGSFCMAVNTGILKNDEITNQYNINVFKNCEQLADLWPSIYSILKGN